MYPDLSQGALKRMSAGLGAVVIALCVIAAVMPAGYVNSIISTYYPVNESCSQLSKRIQLAAMTYVYFIFVLSIVSLLRTVIIYGPWNYRILIAIKASVTLLILCFSYTTLAVLALPPSLFYGQSLCFSIDTMNRSLVFIAYAVMISYATAVSMSLSVKK
ncbi:membrane hypothetical protein [Mesorhizobium plurifarium]|uniref:Uncharacterized protein n=1 Tax=Mesorhizobium plurifarium TaxID=69974 RepID=A0A090FID2_MESPL|nr:membrane hypothetical protein [Mesorhizobium plurifarium]